MIIQVTGWWMRSLLEVGCHPWMSRPESSFRQDSPENIRPEELHTGRCLSGICGGDPWCLWVRLRVSLSMYMWTGGFHLCPAAYPCVESRHDLYLHSEYETGYNCEVDVDHADGWGVLEHWKDRPDCHEGLRDGQDFIWPNYTDMAMTPIPVRVRSGDSFAV